MELIDVIKTRRSTRSFKDREIESEELNLVLEAGKYAPSGCNVQQNHFIVIKDKLVLDVIKELVIEEFSKMDVNENTFGSIKNSVNASQSGNYVFHYDPQILIIVANNIDNPNNIADAACAVENMMLMANELNLGSCWINQLRWLNQNNVIVEYLQGLGMEPEERVYASLALGYADTEDEQPVRTPLARTGNRITFI